MNYSERLRIYEYEKRKLMMQYLSYEEYQKKIEELAKKLKI